MNRNVESHFALAPSVDINRSIFDRSSTHKTAFNVGELIPFYVDEVLPGDTFNVTTSKVCRLQTLLTPVMDNLYLDTYFFFVPNRLVWNHWKEFCGENNSSSWIPSVEYQIPSISSPSGGFNVGTIADYMGLPVGVEWSNNDPRRPSALPFRAYAMIANDFFRSEVVTDPLNIPINDSNQTGTNGSSYINDVANGGMPFKVAKYHDYFSSCTISPQRGPAVSLKLSGATLAPVGTTGVNQSYPSGSTFGHVPLRYSPINAGVEPQEGEKFALGVYANASQAANGYWSSQGLSTTASLLDSHSVTPINLYADVGSVLSAVTVNELRLAFQLQKYYEKMNFGSRYNEWLLVNFGCTSPDSSLQRPQYLGGNRIPITIHEVTNQAQGTNDFLGDLGAMSVTSDIHSDFVQSFTEHGLVIGVCCLRYDHSYPQGLERFWSRRKITDFYLPVFANIGDQPVYKSEIYADSTNMAANYVWAYNEAWSEYRFKPDRCSSEMRPGVSNTLASWHFADYYTQSPTFSDTWMREDKTNVDRTLAVTSANAMQCFADFYVQNICTRCMPMYSIPGLIDHH